MYSVLISTHVFAERIYRYLTVVTLALLICHCCHSQTRNVNIDSLKQLVAVPIHDSTSINNLLFLSYLQTFRYPEEALEYALLVREHAPEVPFEEAWLKSYYMTAKVYTGLGEYDKTKQELDFLDSQESIKLYPEVQCDCHKALGHYYRGINQFDKAIEEYFKSIEIGEKTRDFGCHGGPMISVGGIHEDLQNYDLALEYYDLALKSLQNTDRYHITSDVYYAKADLIDEIDGKKIQLDSAMHYAIKAQNDLLIFRIQWEQASIEFESGNQATARQLFEQATNSSADLDVNVETALFLMEFAVFNQKTGQIARAKRNYNDAITIVAANDGAKVEPNYHRLKSSYAKLIGNDKVALQANEDYIVELEGIRNSERTKAVMSSEIKYQTEKKEIEIERQKYLLDREANSRRLIIGGSIIFILAAGALFFGLFQRAKRKRHQSELALELEKKRSTDLVELGETKTRFFNNISHELRTPLTMIIGPLSSVVKKVKNVTIRSEIELALKNSERLLSLTNEIMDLSKLEAGKLVRDESAVNVSSFLNRVFYSFTSLAESQRIILRSDIQIDQRSTAVLDAPKLEKILNNLIINAIKYSEVDDIVNFKCWSDGTQLNIQVKDQGLGIPAADVDHIFDRYYQSQNTVQHSGTGIGLSLVKELCEFLDGSIEVASEMGVGSTFDLRIPTNFTIDANANGRIATEDSNILNLSPIVIDGMRPRVLVVEDDLDMAKYIDSIFNPYFDIHHAYNGRQALEMLSQHSFDLITSDVMMPEIDGFTLKEKITSSQALDAIPFIMLTARALDEDKLHGLRLGVDDYITKPFNVDELITRAQNLLANNLERRATAIKEPIESNDKKLVEELKKIILSKLDDPSLNVGYLAEQVNYSTRQIGRISKKVTGLSPVALILEVRLLHAFELIKDRKYSTVNEVRYDVGIESASYFSKKFKERFGISAGQVLR